MADGYPRITAALHGTFIENGSQYQESVETSAQQPRYTPDHPHRDLLICEIDEAPMSVLPDTQPHYRINPTLAISLHWAASEVDNSIFAAATAWTPGCGRPVARFIPPIRLNERGIGLPPVLRYPAMLAGHNPLLNTFKTRGDALIAWKDMQRYMRASLAWKAAAMERCSNGRYPEWKWTEPSASYILKKVPRREDGTPFGPGSPLTVGDALRSQVNSSIGVPARTNIGVPAMEATLSTPTHILSGSNPHYRPHTFHDHPADASTSNPFVRSSFVTANNSFSSRPVNREGTLPRHPRHFSKDPSIREQLLRLLFLL
ncbi:hypothetical protein M422DRAFT_51313 [Sphaerobolus stellatus SS14]|uniref:Uncharacterized protein n=1 Tax=Sphaerobolus stellatus (strain SS14) TaxID=990650 RepID=A0A0C9V2P6_SPHS4|nr:hypothetical protein M422DRAFT_51313 [Sphaerobolus stellatus SS14]